MTTRHSALLLILALAATTPTAQGDVTIKVRADEPGKAISTDLIGIFFEDINHAGDGGLYAELVQNRSFEHRASEQPTWNNLSFWNLKVSGRSKGTVAIEEAAPVHPNNPHYAVLEVQESGEGVAFANSGYDGIAVRAGERYELALFAKQLYVGSRWGKRVAGSLPLQVRLESAGGEVLAQTSFNVAQNDWQRFNATLTANRDEPDARVVLVAKMQGGIGLDEVSLLPKKTFRGRPNGLRADLAQTIAELKPKFLRFPGGCLVHGNGLGNMYRWKDTVGPIEQRRQQANLWGYHQTVGLGYFEYFQFAEDIGAKPLPVVPAGVCCQNSDRQGGTGQRGLPMESMADFVQEVLDLIEYANGPVTSKWGAVRAAAGHPAPFNLKYLGIGNEDHITIWFQKRFEMIYAAVKSKHPEITVVGTVGPFAEGEDYDKGWKIADKLAIPMVDEHYYVSPDWFWDHLTRYDGYDRAKSKVYLGEYAAHEKDRRSTLRAALAEAAYLTSLERNGDVVSMASYAPLLGREDFIDWSPNLIYFNGGTGIFPTISYEVQRMFSLNGGDRYLTTTLAGTPPSQRLAASSVRDSESGDVIVKLVNGDNRALALSIQLDGATDLQQLGEVTVLAGEPEQTNDYANARLLKPRKSSIAVARTFSYVAPASSLTILRVKSR